MADKYVMRVTAGPSYDLDTHTVVPVNTAKPVEISTPLMTISLNVRVQNYRGLPPNSPSTSPYFTTPPHQANGDMYSIALQFTPKAPSKGKPTGDKDGKGISGADLQWGNDFDHAIRDRLPPGFNTALNIVRWWIDPGLDGDAYADRPHLYGPALSSFNAVRVGCGTHDDARGGLWVDEGGDEEGAEARQALGCPDGGAARMKWALRKEAKESWVWEYGKTYSADFFNAYLDFSEFALNLPGYKLHIMKYWDGQGLRAKRKRSHTLRYVLRNRSTGELYLAVLFSLYLKEDVSEDGTIDPEALKSSSGAHEPADEGTTAHDEPAFDEKSALDEARRTLSRDNLDVIGAGGVETSPDDVD